MGRGAGADTDQERRPVPTAGAPQREPVGDQRAEAVPVESVRYIEQRAQVCIEFTEQLLGVDDARLPQSGLAARQPHRKHLHIGGETGPPAGEGQRSGARVMKAEQPERRLG